MANVIEPSEDARTSRISALRRPLVICGLVVGSVFMLTMWSMTHKRATANAAEEKEKPAEERLYVPATDRAEQMMKEQADEEAAAQQAQAAADQAAAMAEGPSNGTLPPGTRVSPSKLERAREEMLAEDQLRTLESELQLRREAFAAGTRVQAVDRFNERTIRTAQSFGMGADTTSEDVGVAGLQQLTSLMGQGLAARAAGASGGAPGLVDGTPQGLPPDRHKAADKLNFFQNGGAQLQPGELEYEVQDPKTPYELLMGESIPCALLTKIVSAVPGLISCQVSRDVFDTATGNHLLIPTGAVGVGMYNVQVTAANSARVQVVWTRLNFPNGQRLDLGSMPGADSQGVGGVADQIDRHIAARFGAAVLGSLFTIGVEMTAPQNGSFYGSAINRGLGEAALNTGMQLSQELGDRPPTITIRQGAPLQISVNKDMVFQAPYTAGRRSGSAR